MAKINVKNASVTVIKVNDVDYISLTDIAKYKSDDPTATIGHWMRNRNTLEYLGIWERLYNPNFKPTEFEGFRTEAGLNAFTMSPKKWIEGVNAHFIDEGIPQSERLIKLNQIAIHQMRVLNGDTGNRKLLK